MACWLSCITDFSVVFMLNEISAYFKKRKKEKRKKKHLVAEKGSPFKIQTGQICYLEYGMAIYQFLSCAYPSFLCMFF